MLLAVWGKAAISRLLAGSPDGLHHDLSLDRSVLGFSFGLSLLTSQIAVRMAIGARPRDVARSILGQALLLATFGITLGLPGMMAAGWLVRSQLFGVEPHDPAILASAAAALGTAALLGAGVPAWRATRISPLTAIRSEQGAVRARGEG